MPRPLRQLDREGRPRAVPVATVQVRTPQAAGPTRADKRADDAAVGAASHHEVWHPAGVQAVPDVSVERLIGGQHDEIGLATVRHRSRVTFGSGSANCSCCRGGVPESLVVRQQAARRGMLQYRIALGMNGDMSDTGRGEERTDNRHRPAGTAEHDQGRPATSQDLLGLVSVPDPQCRQIGSEARYSDRRRVGVRTDEETRCGQRADSRLEGFRGRRGWFAVRCVAGERADCGRVDPLEHDRTPTEFQLDARRRAPQHPGSRVQHVSS
jgi:hypothetical protein